MRNVFLFVLINLLVVVLYAQHSPALLQEKGEIPITKKHLIIAQKPDCLTCDLFKRTISSGDLIRTIGRSYNKIELNFSKPNLIQSIPEWDHERYQISTQNSYRINELLERYQSQKTNSPMLMILDEDGSVLQMFTGLIPEHKLQKILNYYAEDHHLKVSWEKYKQGFQ